MNEQGITRNTNSANEVIANFKVVEGKLLEMIRSISSHKTVFEKILNTHVHSAKEELEAAKKEILAIPEKNKALVSDFELKMISYKAEQDSLETKCNEAVKLNKNANSVREEIEAAKREILAILEKNMALASDFELKMISYKAEQEGLENKSNEVIKQFNQVLKNKEMAVEEKLLEMIKRISTHETLFENKLNTHVNSAREEIEAPKSKILTILKKNKALASDFELKMISYKAEQEGLENKSNEVIKQFNQVLKNKEMAVEEKLLEMIKRISTHETLFENKLNTHVNSAREEIEAAKREILTILEKNKALVGDFESMMISCKTEQDNLKSKCNEAVNLNTHTNSAREELGAAKREILTILEKNKALVGDFESMMISYKTEQDSLETKCNVAIKQFNQVLKNKDILYKIKTKIDEFEKKGDEKVKLIESTAKTQNESLIRSIEAHVAESSRKAFQDKFNSILETEVRDFSNRCELTSTETMKTLGETTRVKMERISRSMEQAASNEVLRIQKINRHLTWGKAIKALGLLLLVNIIVSFITAKVAVSNINVHAGTSLAKNQGKDSETANAEMEKPIASDDLQIPAANKKLEITPEKARDYLGKQVTIRMAVHDSRPDPKNPDKVYCNSVGYKKPGNFAIILMDATIKKYEEKNNKKINRNSIRNLKANGIVKIYGDDFQIWVESVEDILELDG